MVLRLVISVLIGARAAVTACVIASNVAWSTAKVEALAVMVIARDDGAWDWVGFIRVVVWR